MSSIHRLVSIPLSRNSFAKEIILIKRIAEINGLNIDVHRLAKKKMLKKLLTERNPPPPSNQKRKKWLRLPYLGRPSEMLARDLRRFGYSPAFYPITTLRNLSSLKDKIPPEDKAGVYRVTCGECPATYIGQTGRALSKRIEEHKAAFFSKKPSKSAVGLHCVAFNHDPEKITVELIHSCKKSQLLNRLEEVETVKYYNADKHHSLNDMEATYFNPIVRYILNYSTDTDIHD